MELSSLTSQLLLAPFEHTGTEFDAITSSGKSDKFVLESTKHMSHCAYKSANSSSLTIPKLPCLKLILYPLTSHPAKTTSTFGTILDNFSKASNPNSKSRLAVTGLA